MPDLEQDGRFLKAGVESLADYLLSAELFYPLGGDMPRLTIGNLLLARLRVMAVEPAMDDGQVVALKEKWKAAWEQKATREIHTRLELWQNFLGEYRTSPANQADRYSVEVRHRVIIQLLSVEITHAHDLSQLPGLDLRLENSFIPGDFVWEEQVASGFDPRKFWYLYGMLKSK